MLAATLVWVSIAQWQMGESWRIGIDEQHAEYCQKTNRWLSLK